MNVRDIMEKVFVTVGEDATYRYVAKMLYESKHGCVFVVDGLDRLVGLVSEHDLLRVLFPYYQSYYLNPEAYTDPEEREKKIEEVQDHPATRFMYKAIHSASPADPIMRTGATMLAKDVRYMPVIDDGKLVGVVTRQAIYRTLFEQHLKQN